MNNPLATLTDQFLKERTYLKNVTPATLVWYRVAFKNYSAAFTDGVPPLPTKATLQEFVIRQRQRNLRAVTVNTYIGAMNAFCSWLHEEGHVVDRVKLPKLRSERRVLQLLNDAQMRALIGYKPTSFGQKRVHLAALLVLDTGLRVSEALNLRRAHVDHDNLILRVFGKGQKERFVPFSPELRKRLFRFEQLGQKKGIRSDFAFAGSRGGRWEKRNSATSLYLMERKLGLPTFGWHRLRHTFATNYLRQGGDIVRLSMVLGHTQITTTQRYLHLLTEDLTANHQKVSILNRLG
jgi:integrase/recombinase XerD